MGYDINREDNRLLNMTDRAKQNAREYCRKVCAALESHDMEIDYSVLENINGIITKHDITLSVTNKNMSNYDFHNKWLSENSPLNIAMDRFQAGKVIRTIQKCGGKSICAHLPRTLEQTDDTELFPYVCESLIRAGLDGFEVFYANSSIEQVRTMYELCSSQGLLMTGGSDFHGVNRKGRCGLGEYNRYSGVFAGSGKGILYNVTNASDCDTAEAVA